MGWALAQRTTLTTLESTCDQMEALDQVHVHLEHPSSLATKWKVAPVAHHDQANFLSSRISHLGILTIQHLARMELHYQTEYRLGTLCLALSTTP